METPVTFRNKGQQLVGVLHLPVSRRASPVSPPAVVLFHGFTGTHIEPHRLFVHAARALARSGIVALRFDFRGSGDSEGNFEDMTVAGEVSDGLAALNFLVRQKGVDGRRLGILGLSLGGVVAMWVAAQLARRTARLSLSSLVLWAAPAVGRDIVAARSDPAAIRQLQTRGFVDRGGNPVGRRFIEEYETMAQQEALARSRCPVLIIHGSRDESVPVTHADQLEAAAKKTARRVAKLILPGADHTFNRLDWQQQAIGATVRWFRETLGTRNASATAPGEIHRGR